MDERVLKELQRIRRGIYCVGIAILFTDLLYINPMTDTSLVSVGLIVMIFIFTRSP